MSTPEPPSSPREPHFTIPESPQTTMHVRRARDGDESSLSWIAERLTPLLLAQAEYRLGPALRKHADPHDLVNEAWLATLPKLRELTARDGRLTPVLMKYLSNSMNYRIGEILRSRLRMEPARCVLESRFAELRRSRSNVDASIQRSEMARRVRDLLAVLRPKYREMIVLRGIEQRSRKAIAEMLGISVDLVDKRYSRALQRLRRDLPNSVFDEFLDG